MTLHYELTIPFALFFASSCLVDKEEPVSLPIQQPIPLKVGNSWTYTVSAFDSAGTLVRSWDSTWTISRDTIIGTTRWYLFANEQWGYTGRGPLYAMTDGGLISDWPTLCTIYNPKADDSYRSMAFDSALYSADGFPITRYYHPVDVRLADTHPEIQVPAGRFVCDSYSFLRSTSNFNFSPEHVDYLVPGIGVLKKSLYTHKHPRSYPLATVLRTEIYELKNYTAN